METTQLHRGRLIDPVHLIARDLAAIRRFYDAALGAVDRFYAAALAAGGTAHGKPGVRVEYHPGYYGALVIDPDGSNIEAVFHGEADKSAESVVISFKE